MHIFTFSVFLQLLIFITFSSSNFSIMKGNCNPTASISPASLTSQTTLNFSWNVWLSLEILVQVHRVNTKDEENPSSHCPQRNLRKILLKFKWKTGFTNESFLVVSAINFWINSQTTTTTAAHSIESNWEERKTTINNGRANFENLLLLSVPTEWLYYRWCIGHHPLDYQHHPRICDQSGVQDHSIGLAALQRRQNHSGY